MSTNSKPNQYKCTTNNKLIFHYRTGYILMLEIKKEELQQLSRDCGLELFSVVSNCNLSDDKESLNKWQEQGFAGEMKYMNRSSELLANPDNLLTGYKSILVFAVFYDQAKFPIPIGEIGKVARYAWGKDYHTVLKNRLNNLILKIENRYKEGLKYRFFSDAVPLLERAIAREANLGFIGKNSMLIKPGRGSFFFLAEILSNIDVIQEKTLPSNGHCGSCHQCQSSCPTEAIVSDRVVDARKCISYLTIEKRGALSYDEREAIGGWLFGCDICQEVCPFNHGPLKSENKPDLPEFSAQNGVGPFLSLREVLKIRDEKDFLAKFKDTALLRAKREGLLRNACVVARNKKYFNLTSLLEDCVSNDSSEIIRSHALWALSEFARFQEGIKKERLNFLLNKCLNDNSHIVSSEARQLCNGS